MMSWNAEYFHNEDISSPSSLLSGLFKVPRCADHLLENLFTIFVFRKVSKSNNVIVCCCSFHFTVLLTFRFTCYHSNQETMLRINESNKHFHVYSVARVTGLGLGQVFPNFLWPCTPSAFR